MVPMGVCAGIPTLVSTLLGDPMGEPIVGEANMLMYGWLPRVAVTTLPNRQQLSIHQLIVGIFYAWALMHVLCVAARARVLCASSYRALLMPRALALTFNFGGAAPTRRRARAAGGHFLFFSVGFCPGTTRRCDAPMPPSPRSNTTTTTVFNNITWLRPLKHP